MKLTGEHLRALLHSDGEGRLVWLPRDGQPQWNAKYAGKEAFTATDRHGYRVGSIHNRLYRAHRIIFAMHFDVWPAEIDHIDGNRTNNRLGNLAATTRAANARNLGFQRSDSGVVGVTYNAKRDRWLASIGSRGKQRLKSFRTKDEAVAQRRQWEAEFGYHPNHGRPKAREIEAIKWERGQ